MSMNQPVIAQPPIGLPLIAAITQCTHPLAIRSDLMPSTDLEMDHQDSVQEPESEPPAPGTEELSIEELAPSPSKFLIFLCYANFVNRLKYRTTILIVVMSAWDVPEWDHQS